MRTKIYWVLTLIATLTLCAAVMFFCRTFDRFEMIASKGAVLQREVQSLEYAIDATKHKRKIVQEWKGLLDAAQNAGLTKKGWRAYPVNVSRELTWNELSTLVLIASNGKPRGDDYWFQPELLRVVRVESDEKNDTQEPASDKPVEKRYRIRLKGDFLIAVHENAL